MSLCFLFGSGASIPADYAAVSKITEDILSDEKIDHTDSAFSPQDSSANVVPFLRWLKAFADARYVREAGHRTNYEDIYFLASQIRDDLLGEFDNPAVRPLIEKVILEFMLPEDNLSANLGSTLEKLATDSCDHIRRQVAAALNKPPSRTGHLAFLAEAIQDDGDKQIAFITLNHDTLLESWLQGHSIEFVDGFSKLPNEVKIRVWQPSSFAGADESVRLLKLHGGVNWYRLRPDDAKPWTEDYVGIPPAELPSGRTDEQGRRHCNLDQLPMLLIGTFNKMSDYTAPVYLELYHQAFVALERADALVIIGYGFADKGINKLVTEWIYRSPKRQLVVVDKHADTLPQRARGAISNKWHDWIEARRLFPLQRDLTRNALAWGEVSKVLRP